jgi:hypothetical protein
MSSERLRDEGLAALEAALAGLAPAPPAFDRDRLLFRAGQESAPGRSRLWPWATGVLAAVAAGLGALLVLRPEPKSVERVVYVKDEAPPVQPAVAPAPPVAAPQTPEETAADAEERARFSAFRLQREALRWGVEALPRRTGPTDAAGPDRASVPPVPTYQQLRLSFQARGSL